MSIAFALLSALTLLGAVGAISLRNPVHCALSVALAFAGLAGHYLRLNAQFAGLAQLLVYIGAVAILIVFAILLTGGGNAEKRGRWSGTALAGAAVAGGMAVVLVLVVGGSESLEISQGVAPASEVRRIGELLMSRYVLPLEVAAVLLTAAMIAAIVLAMPARPPGKGGSRE